MTTQNSEVYTHEIFHNIHCIMEKGM